MFAIYRPIILGALFLGCLVSADNRSTFQSSGVPFENPVTVASGFDAHILFSNLTTPRGIAFDSVGNLLVVERGFGITAFTEARNGSGWERTVVIASPNFTQGIQVDDNRLYVSTAGQALVYNYNAAAKTVEENPAIVVNGIPPDGDLTTHTLQLQRIGTTTKLLIASGPFTNIDPTARDPSSGRSQIRSFILPRNPFDSTPQNFINGDLIAFGIRNPAGLAFSPTSPSTTLYVVENGASIDNTTGLTAAFVNDNPADELELVDLQQPAATYGFPDCTTLWNPFADPVGDENFTNLTQGAQFSLLLEPDKGDAFCQDQRNNIPPALSFQAHSVPLDIKFYAPPENSSQHAFPQSFKNDAFVALHGSFSRIPPTGYGVVHVPFSGPDLSTENISFMIQVTDLAPCPGHCIRPVGLAFGIDGRLYVSSDGSGEVGFNSLNLNIIIIKPTSKLFVIEAV
ncbi:hypothetical protein BU17DRAFT_36439 [Hysterangium stoloniferum]|nr:hypothetical protein BU17DRAFT_36439 [Hysterangium stoloniferum]